MRNDCRAASPRTDKLNATNIQWAEKIMEKIDARFSRPKA